MNGRRWEKEQQELCYVCCNDKDTSELVSLLSQVAIALCDEKVIETLLNTESEAEIFTLFNRKGEQ